MKKILPLIFILINIGCASKRHTVSDKTITTDTCQVITTYADSAIKIDTSQVQKTTTTTIETSAKSEAELFESWDNVTRTWTDSLGRSVTEKHEKGSRLTTQKDQSEYIQSITDSLAFFKRESLQWETRYMNASKHIQELLVEHTTEKVEPKRKPSVLQTLGLLFAGALLGFLTSVFIRCVRTV